MYTLDTNAIIYYLKDDSGAVEKLNSIFTQHTPLYLSAITEVELFGFPSLNESEIMKIETILETMAIIPLDSRIARTAGEIQRLYRLKIADSVIAATALFTGRLYLPEILVISEKSAIYWYSVYEFSHNSLL